MVVDVHFQVVDLAFESLELGKDGALLGDLGVHRLDRGHQRSNGQCNGRHHLLCHGWPHPSFNLFREGPNFVVLLHKDSSNFGEGYADGFERMSSPSSARAVSGGEFSAIVITESRRGVSRCLPPAAIS